MIHWSRAGHSFERRRGRSGPGKWLWQSVVGATSGASDAYSKGDLSMAPFDEEQARAAAEVARDCRHAESH